MSATYHTFFYTPRMLTVGLISTEWVYELQEVLSKLGRDLI